MHEQQDWAPPNIRHCNMRTAHSEGYGLKWPNAFREPLRPAERKPIGGGTVMSSSLTGHNRNRLPRVGLFKSIGR